MIINFLGIDTQSINTHTHTQILIKLGIFVKIFIKFNFYTTHTQLFLGKNNFNNYIKSNDIISCHFKMNLTKQISFFFIHLIEITLLIKIFQNNIIEPELYTPKKLGFGYGLGKNYI